MFYLKDGLDLYRVKKEEILYLQQEERNIRVVTRGRDFFVKRMKVGELLNSLGESFFQCHTYLLINLDKVEIVKKHEVVMEDKRTVGMCYAATCRVKKELEKNSGFKKKTT